MARNKRSFLTLLTISRFFLLWCFFIVSLNMAVAAPANIILTPEEQAWLKQNPEIRIGSGESWKPYIWREQDGSFAGIETDIIARINALSGANIRFELGEWSEIVARAQRGELYGLALSARHAEREAAFLFSDSPYSAYKYIFTRQGSPVTQMEDLRGLRVGIVKGNLSAIKTLQQWPDLTIVEVESLIQLLVDLQNGSLDAVFAGANLHWVARENLAADIQMAFFVPGSQLELLYSIHKDHPELLSIINKSLAAIEASEILAIFKKWGVTKQPRMWLTAAEQSYLSGIIFRREQTDWMPLSFKDEDGLDIGIAEDYWQLIREKLGLKESVSEVTTFSELLQRLKNGEADIYAGTTETADRKTFARFSDSYEQYPIAVATRKNVGFIANASILERKIVAVGENYSAYHLLQERFPGVQFLQVRDTAAALSRVAAGEAYAAVDILPVLQYHIEQFPDASIKLSGVTDVQFPLQVMVSGQHERLVPLINRAIAAITDEERAAIHEKWVLRDVVRATDYNLLWQVLFFSVVTVSLILYWNYRLRHEIRVRTQAERLLSDSESALLKAKEKAEAANEAKTQFLANISHELRTPIHALMGIGHLLRQTGLNKTQADYLDKMESSSRLLLGVVNNVLDISKIESGHVKLESVEFSPGEVLRGISCLLADEARKKGLGFHVEIAENIPQCLLGDRQLLTQILLNLAANAVKFTERGAVWISACCLSQNEQHSRLRFCVKDTGPGISKAQQQQLFQRFAQLDNSLTRRHQGSGLGLAISQAFAQQMGGKIDLDSGPGQGSTFMFTIDFPHCPKDVSEKNTVNPALSPESGMIHVLLVEDNELNQLLASKILESLGAVVMVANNGAEAIEKLAQADFSVVFMDLQMPEMDGYEAVRLIRQQRGGNQLPIIAMTAHTAAEEREKCLAAGMNDYLGKPFRPEQLARMLVKWGASDQSVSLRTGASMARKTQINYF